VSPGFPARLRRAAALPFGDRAMATQISAHISDETRSQIESFERRHGITKASLIGEALQHHLAALREIPDDVVVRARLVLRPESFNDIVAEIESDAAPSAPLRELIRGDA
jgi:hypothetical protein